MHCYAMRGYPNSQYLLISRSIMLDIQHAQQSATYTKSECKNEQSRIEQQKCHY